MTGGGDIVNKTDMVLVSMDLQSRKGNRHQTQTSSLPAHEAGQWQGNEGGLRMLGEAPDLTWDVRDRQEKSRPALQIPRYT